MQWYEVVVLLKNQHAEELQEQIEKDKQQIDELKNEIEKMKADLYRTRRACSIQ